MSKLTEIVNGVADTVKASFKERRIMKALDSAMLNAQEELEVANAKLEEFPMKAADMEAEAIVSNLVTLMGDKKDAEYTLEVLNDVKKYLE